MRIDDIVYFSPTLRLRDLNLNDKAQILKHFPERINAYYLNPISILVKNKMAFAAGSIECLLNRRSFTIFFKRKCSRQKDY